MDPVKLKNQLVSDLFPEDVSEIVRMNNIRILENTNRSGLLVGAFSIDDILELLEKLTGKIFIAYNNSDFFNFSSIEETISWLLDCKVLTESRERNIFNFSTNIIYQKNTSPRNFQTTPIQFTKDSYEKVLEKYYSDS